MDLLTRSDLPTLLEEKGTPCVSLFQPTSRGGAEADPKRFKLLLGEAYDELYRAGLSKAETEAFLKPAFLLYEDPLFWKNQSDGLAFFLAQDVLRIYRLPMTFLPNVTVGPRFQIRPLLPYLSEDGRFYVLALSKNAVRLLQGTRHAISEVDLTGVPRSLAEAMLLHDRDEPLNFHTRPVGGVGSWGAIFSGQGVGIDDQKEDLFRYFKQLDHGLHAILRDERVPLVVAAVDYLLPIYREANTYPYLEEMGLVGSPDRESNEILHKRAVELLKPRVAVEKERALSQFTQLAGTGRTVTGLWEVLPAAYAGEIETLFVMEGRECKGHFDPMSGAIEEHEPPLPGDEDLLNLAVVQTLSHGRKVYTLPADQMPGHVPVAGVFCLPLAKHAGK